MTIIPVLSARREGSRMRPGTLWMIPTFYPFGGERAIVSTSGNNFKFAGTERDSESGLDDFGGQYDSSSLGRFMSPHRSF